MHYMYKIDRIDNDGRFATNKTIPASLPQGGKAPLSLLESGSSLAGNALFPVRKPRVPSKGTGRYLPYNDHSLLGGLLRTLLMMLLLLPLGTTGAWGQTYYVFKYGSHYLAHNGYTTDGSEICVVDEFSIEKCLWEFSEYSPYTSAIKNKKYLKTYGADFWLYYSEDQSVATNYKYPLRLKEDEPNLTDKTAEDGWRKADAGGIMRRFKTSSSDTSWPEHYICYNDAATPFWELSRSNTKKVLGTVISATTASYQGPQATITGDDELTDYGTFDYSATPTITATSYPKFTVDGTDYYWYEGADHGTTLPEDWSGTLTSTWGISDNDGYATIDEDGKVTVHKIPGTDLLLTIQLTVTDGTHSCVFTKSVTLKGSGLYVIKDDLGRYMQLSGTSLGVSTAFNADNAVWTNAANGVGSQYTIVYDENTYFLQIANWTGPDNTPLEARASTITGDPGYNHRWSGVSPDYLKSAGGYYVYRDNDLWKLTKDEETDHRVQAIPVTTSEGNYTTFTSGIIGGDKVISAPGEYEYTAANVTFNSGVYTAYTFDDKTHYWYDGNDHNNFSTYWGNTDEENLTRTWSMVGGSGYATFDPETGMLTVIALPTESPVIITLTYTVSNGEHSHSVSKNITIKPAAITPPTISVDSDGKLEISSNQHSDLEFYYETGANEPATAMPTAESVLYDEDNKPTIDGVACIKAIAVYQSDQSEVAIYNRLHFYQIDQAAATPTVAPFVYSSDAVTPTGLTAYIVTRVIPSDRSVMLASLSYIPKDVPVLLIDRRSTGTYTGLIGFTLEPWVESETNKPVDASTLTANQLKLSNGKETVDDAQIYLFHEGEFVLTLGTVEEEKMPAGRYYLLNPNYRATTQPSASSGARLQLVFDDATGISLIPNLSPKGEGSWHSLDGRRLSGQPTQKGVYINNGRKVVIK